jgi:hypothetical protein
MPRGFGRLPFLTRRSSADQPASEPALIRRGPADPDAVPVGPPILLPASIVRQVLFDGNELTPAWARPRSTPEPAAATAAEPADPEPAASTSAVADPPAEQAARKRTRRAPAGGMPKAGATDATPRRPRRPGRAAKTDGCGGPGSSRPRVTPPRAARPGSSRPRVTRPRAAPRPG